MDPILIIIDWSARHRHRRRSSDSNSMDPSIIIINGLTCRLRSSSDSGSMNPIIIIIDGSARRRRHCQRCHHRHAHQ